VFHITLEQGHSLLTMLAVAAAAVVLAGVFYRRIFAQVMPSRWRLLLALRTVAILLVVFLLFRPVLSLEREEFQRRAVILALDTSSSMSTADDATGTTRFEQARTRVLDWSSRLKKDFDLHVLEFSERATPLDRPGDLERLKPAGEATSLTRALVAGARAVPRRDVEAVVLFSDGIHNAAGDPVAAARKLGVVVHAIGVGNGLRNSPSYRDARVADLDCPEQLPVNNRARITAHVGQAGLGGQVVKAILEEDGKPLDQAEIVLRDGDAPQAVVFQFVPTVKGRHTYTVRIPPVPEEKIAQNNHRSAVVQVVDSKIRVLYLEGTLRAEYGAIVQRFLSRDPDLEFCALVQTRPNVFVQRTNMEGLKLPGFPRTRRPWRSSTCSCWATWTAVTGSESPWSCWCSGFVQGPDCWRSAVIIAWGPEATEGLRSRESCRSSREIGTSARSPIRSCRFSPRRGATTRSSPTSASSSRARARRLSPSGCHPWTVACASRGHGPAPWCWRRILARTASCPFWLFNPLAITKL